MGDELLQTTQEVSRFRSLVLAAVVIGCLFRPTTIQAIPLFVLGILYLAYLLLLRYVVFPRYFSTYLVPGMILIDVICITLTLHFTGGVQSLLFTLYPISIMYSAVYSGYFSAFFAATMVSLAYGGFLMIQGTPENVAAFLPVQMPFFYVLAALSGYVVQREIGQRQQARTLREMLQMERGAKEILKVTRELNSTLNREEVLHRVASLACQATGLSRCVFALFDKERNAMVGEATNVSLPNLGFNDIHDLVVPMREGGVTQTAMATGKPVVIENARNDPRVPPGMAERLRLGSTLIVPLYSEEQLLGVMYLDDSGKEHRFTEGDIRAAQTFAEQAAIAITNAQLYGDAQEHIQNLLSEMRALMQKKEPPPRALRTQALKYGSLEISIPQRRVFAGGKAINLSWTEFELLHFLASNPDSAYTRESIFRKVWKQEYYISTNLVDVCVHRLRQKIETDPANPRYVLTVHGVGYMFAEAPQPRAK